MISHSEYQKIISSGIDMSEKEALTYYMPYDRKHLKLVNEMLKDDFPEHVEKNRDYYQAGYIWAACSFKGGENIELPIRPRMPTKLVGYMSNFFKISFFPSLTRKIVTKNGKLMSRLRRKYKR